MKSFWNAHWFLVLVLSIASIGGFIWLYVFNKDKLKAKWWEIVLVVISHTIFGVLMVKFFALLEAGFDAKKAGSMSLYGGIFFMPIYYLIYAKIKKLPFSVVFDLFTINLAFTLLLARINCFHSGCCLGEVIPNTDIRYPTREIDASMHALFVAIAIFIILKGKFKGFIYPIYMIYYGVGRFILEFFRVSSSTNTLHIAHVWSIISIAIGVIFIFINIYLTKKQNNINNKKNGNK